MECMDEPLAALDGNFQGIVIFCWCRLLLGCHAERSAALQVTRAPGRTTERGTCWTEPEAVLAVLEGVHSL